MTMETTGVGTLHRREQPPHVRGRPGLRQGDTTVPLAQNFDYNWESWNELRSHIKGDWYNWEHTTLARLSQGIVAPILHLNFLDNSNKSFSQIFYIK